MNSFTEIIDAIGTTYEVGRKLGTSQQNASRMRVRDTIPTKYWAKVCKLVDGVDGAKLAELAMRRKK